MDDPYPAWRTLMATTEKRASENWRVEHAVLRREAAHLARVASALSEWSVPDTPDQLERIRGFLHGRLLPHARAEEAALYPIMNKLMATEQFIITMQADHDAIRGRAEALTTLIAALGQGPPTASQTEALREHLYGLWAIVDLHLDKEEHLLFDLLDARLTPTDARTLKRQTRAFTSGTPSLVAPPQLRPLIHTEPA